MPTNPKYSPNPQYSDSYNAAMQKAYRGAFGGYSWWDQLTDPAVVKNQEFYQGLMAENMANEYNSPVNQMRRLRAAGINPNLAASAIAQGSSEMQAAPAGTSDPSINPVSVAEGAAQVVGAASSMAEGYKAFKEANRVDDIVDNDIARTTAEIDKWSHENGFTDSQTEAFNIDNMTRSEANQAELNVKRQQFDNMKKEADRIQAQKQYIDKQIQWYDEQITAEIDLSKKRALESEKHGFLMDEQKRTEQMENDFCERFGYRRGVPFDVAMSDLWFQGRYDDVQKAQDFMYKYKYGVAYNETSGQQTAISENAFSIANAQETARSLNSIITDWNTPSSGLWEFLDKSFNVTGNKGGKNVIPNAQAAKSNPDAMSGYTQFVVALQMTMDNLDKDLESASARNEFRRVRELTKERDGLMRFMSELTFDEYCNRMYGEKGAAK